jgi:ankyrin repeat protein
MVENSRKLVFKKCCLTFMAAAAISMSPVQDGFAAASSLSNFSPIEVSPVGDFEEASSLCRLNDPNSDANPMWAPIFFISGWNGGSEDVLTTTSKDSEQGWTALHYAAEEGNVSLVRSLIEKGTDVNSVTFKDKYTPLHRACEEGHSEVVVLLLDLNADYEQLDRRKWTPLHWASLYNHLEIVRNLLNANANVNARTKLGITPLHAASSRDSEIDILKVLIYFGASVEATCLEGLTPLHSAASKGNHDAVVWLIDNGSSISSVDNVGRTPLFYAAAHGNINVVRLLIYKKANVESRDRKGKFAIDLAELKGYSEISSLLKDAQELQPEELTSSDEITLQCFVDNELYLHAAAFVGSKKDVVRLLADGKDPLEQDARLCIPLHYAVKKGHTDVVRYLAIVSNITPGVSWKKKMRLFVVIAAIPTVFFIYKFVRSRV